MKGRRQVKGGFLSLETIETWIVYVCHLDGEWAVQSSFELGMAVGARCISLSVKNCNAVFLRSTVSSVYEEWSITQRTSKQLDTTMGSIGVNMGQHPYGTLLTLCRVHAPANRGCSEDKGGATQY
jgi:hypothetical protein